MKLTLLTAALVSGALAAPAPVSDAEAFPIDELLVSKLTPEEHAVSKRQYSSSTYNQLTDGTACRPISLIYARGTGQQGNVGDAAAVGPLFFNQIASRVGGTSQLAIQGVTYSASVSGFLQGGDPTGSTTMTNLISSVSLAVYVNIWRYMVADTLHRLLLVAPIPRSFCLVTLRVLSSCITLLSAPPQQTLLV
jgi:cutinase